MTTQSAIKKPLKSKEAPKAPGNRQIGPLSVANVGTYTSVLGGCALATGHLVLENVLSIQAQETGAGDGRRTYLQG